MLSVVGPETSLDKIFGPLYSSELLQSFYGGIKEIHSCGRSTVASAAPCNLSSAAFGLPQSCHSKSLHVEHSLLCFIEWP